MTDRPVRRFAARVATVGLVAAACVCTAAVETPARAADDGLVTDKTLSPDLALDAARAALARCRADGFQIAVVVLDRFGQTQVLLRDRFAGLPSPEAATRKAYTAVGFRAATGDLAQAIATGQMDPALSRLPNVAMLRGGLPIESAGALLGGIGVAGAPGGDKDEACAKAGLDAIRDRLDF